jgi:HSP20 family protein
MEDGTHFLGELERLRNEVNRRVEAALHGAGYDASSGAPPGMWVPAVDVVRTDDAFVVHADVPGVSLQDLEVQLEGDRLELSGLRRPPTEGRHFLRLESSYGRFRWFYGLPEPVHAEHRRETLERGVLTVVLPRA